MARLRWEEKPTPRRMSWRERSRVIYVLRSALEERSEVLLAVVYGGFIRREVFRDVDIAVYTAGRIPYHDEPHYTYVLGLELSRRVGLTVDVKLLDYAPPRFRATVLSTGVVILSRLPGLRASLLLRALDELRGLARAARGKLDYKL